MSMKALTTNFSYNIISVENDPGSGQKLALAFQNEGAELKVATYDSDADSQVVSHRPQLETSFEQIPCSGP